jgi:hypothetical protein
MRLLRYIPFTECITPRRCLIRSSAQGIRRGTVRSIVDTRSNAGTRSLWPANHRMSIYEWNLGRNGYKTPKKLPGAMPIAARFAFNRDGDLAPAIGARPTAQRASSFFVNDSADAAAPGKQRMRLHPGAQARIDDDRRTHQGCRWLARPRRRCPKSKPQNAMTAAFETVRAFAPHRQPVKSNTELSNL